jgi:hypothetical protein
MDPWLDYDHLDTVGYDDLDETEYDALPARVEPAADARSSLVIHWSFTVIE